MVTSGAPTSKPPTGSTGTEVHSDLLLHGLRRGEREAFARYFELYRTPVHDLVWRLLRDGEDAVSATEEVFTRVYRRILLHHGPLDVSGWTYGAAIDVCRERLDEREADHRATGGPEADGSEPNDLGPRFGQALAMLEFRHQAVLLLHDVTGLRHADLANVFGLTEGAAGALLFRAREEFRRAFDESSSDRLAGTCRLAEQTAAGAVGRGLSDDEARRLDAHADYCRHCRRAMRGWGEGGGPVTLALFLERTPLPEALTTTPVFGTAIAVAGATNAASDPGSLKVILAQVGRLLTSRAAAFSLAAICLAVAVGLAVQRSPVDRVFIPLPAMMPRGPTHVQPDASAVRPSASGSGQVVATSSTSVTGAAAPVDWYAGTIRPAVAVVANMAPSPAGGRPMVGLQTTAGAGEPSAVTHEGDTKGGGKKPKNGNASAGPGHSGTGNGGHAGSAGTHRGNSATHAQDGGKQPAKTAKKDDAGKHQKPAKPAKDH